MSFLNHLRIRTRLLLAILVPVLLTAGVLSWITVSEIRANGQAELQRLEDRLIESRKRGLQDLVGAAKAVVLEAKNDPDLSEEEAKAEAASRLRSIRFDKTNYVFAYTRDVYNLAYAPDPSKEGPTTHPKVRQLVADLFRAAGGDGFYSYSWINPASGKEEPKISYSTVIPGWDWMIGAGVYVTDIEAEVAATRAEIDEAMADALISTVLTAAVVIVVSLLIGAFVGRTVSQPLNRVSELMKDIADGDGDLRQRLPEDGTDELAELGRRFNHFVVKIQDTMREVGKTTEQLASAAEELSSVANETRQSVEEQGSETDPRSPPPSTKWPPPSSRLRATPVMPSAPRPTPIAWPARVAPPSSPPRVRSTSCRRRCWKPHAPSTRWRKSRMRFRACWMSSMPSPSRPTCWP